MNSRDVILSRIRAAQGRRGAPSAPENAAVESPVEAHIAAHPSGPRPQSDWDPLTRLRERALSLTTTLDEVADLAAVPATVARYLQHNQLPMQAVCWPELGALDWQAAGLQVAARDATGDDLVGITGAFCAIAETGTLMLLSGAATPGVTSLLPETHIAVLPVSRIVRGMEDAWALQRAEHGNAMPRAVNFISGPSRTADIEQTLVLGAHGPYRLHIILVQS